MVTFSELRAYRILGGSLSTAFPVDTEEEESVHKAADEIIKLAEDIKYERRIEQVKGRQ